VNSAWVDAIVRFNISRKHRARRHKGIDATNTAPLKERPRREDCPDRHSGVQWLAPPREILFTPMPAQLPSSMNFRVHNDRGELASHGI
jgi:hypothetical protein